jgi:nitroreductase
MASPASLARTPIPADMAADLIQTAARAPSIHNTQPWRFKISKYHIDLYADPDRKLRVDPIGREMLISCGAALFGLRLGIRSLGYLPVVELLPDASRLRLLARVRLGAPEPASVLEQQLFEATPHRHTHRGPFAGDPIPGGLLAALQHDAVMEKAILAPISRAREYRQLSDILRAASRRQDLDAQSEADIRDWTRIHGSTARDGVPAAAFGSAASRAQGRLRQRDFDLGRGIGLLESGGPPPAVTAVLLTARDGRSDWLRAGQALHRALLHAATKWVFANIYTQPLEAAAIRGLIRERLGLPGAPQVLLQLGVAHTAQATARRPPSELIEG